VPYITGDEIRVAFTGTVTGTDTYENVQSTFAVRDSSGFTHYLFLDERSAWEEILDESVLVREEGGTRALAPEEGEHIRVAFTVTIPVSSVTTPPAGTTEVRTGRNFYHYLNLASPAITRVQPELTPGQEKLLTALVGKDTVTGTVTPVTPQPVPGRLPEQPRFTAFQDLILEFTGTVVTFSTEKAVTSKVTDSAGFTHYLYLNNPVILKEVTGKLSAPEAGNAIRVRLPFRLNPVSLTAPPADTVTVRDTLAGQKWAHFVNLDSPAVRLASEPATKTAASRPAPEAAPAFSKASTLITASAVAARIAVLKGATTWQVTRNRDGQAVHTAATRQLCEDWLEEEGYRPERFTISRAPGTDSARTELASLRALQQDIADKAPGRADWELLPDGFFDEEWARTEAIAVLGASTDLSQWPLSEVDWKDASDERVRELYTNIVFDGADFWLRD
jgi:hypothetical protein